MYMYINLNDHIQTVKQKHANAFLTFELTFKHGCTHVHGILNKNH